ncbi:transcriptional regulator [Streptomyces albidoflavus]|nr:transcriptional regulator [Streptomyces albidoflavus]
MIVALVDFTTGQEAEPVVVGARTGERLDDSEAYVFTAGPAASAAMRGGGTRRGGGRRALAAARSA